MNYGEVKTHFKALLNRSDVTPVLTSTFIDQGIARIQRQLRTPLNEKKADYTFSASSSSITLPNDFLEIISVYIDQYELTRISMSDYRALQSSTTVGTPVHFVREQEKLLLYPKPQTGTLSLYYYSEFPALVDDTDTNKLTKVASDLIIYSALTFAADYYLDDRAEIFETKFNQFFNELQEQANDQELNGGPQALYTRYNFGDD